MESQINNQNKRALIALLGSLCLLVSFQNFRLLPEDLIGLPPVDEKLREDHARELLGSKYQKSTAAQKNQFADLHFKLYQEVRRQLAPAHRPKAFRLTQAILKESAQYNFDPVFIAAIIKTESRYNPYAIGGVGEIGLMQIRPETAEWIAKKYKIPFDGPQDLRDPAKNIRIGVAYMDYLRATFPAKAYRYIAAYNMGPKNVRKLLAQDKKPQEYPSRIYQNYHDTYERMTSKAIKTDSMVQL